MVPNPTWSLILSLVAIVTVVGSGRSENVIRVADRCGLNASGSMDVGARHCEQIGSGYVSSGSREGWSNGNTSNAGLRSDGIGMMPGVGNARHLRIQANPDFR